MTTDSVLLVPVPEYDEVVPLLVPLVQDRVQVLLHLLDLVNQVLQSNLKTRNLETAQHLYNQEQEIGQFFSFNVCLNILPR